MASKKPSIKIPLDDIVRNAIRAAGKKTRSIGKAVKKADAAAKAAKAAKFRAKYGTAAQRAAARAKRLGPSMTFEQRFNAKKALFREYDKKLKAIEVNERLAQENPNLLTWRERIDKPVTKKQIRDAQRIDKGLKNKQPKRVKKDADMPENQLLADALARAEKKAAWKAAGGRNSPANIAKRQKRQAQNRQKIADELKKKRNKK